MHSPFHTHLSSALDRALTAHRGHSVQCGFKAAPPIFIKQGSGCSGAGCLHTLSLTHIWTPPSSTLGKPGGREDPRLGPDGNPEKGQELGVSGNEEGESPGPRGPQIAGKVGMGKQGTGDRRESGLAGEEPGEGKRASSAPAWAPQATAAPPAPAALFSDPHLAKAEAAATERPGRPGQD